MVRLEESREIELNEFLNWLKKEIKESEDESTVREPEYKDYVPNIKESRELFFRTTELEVELSVCVTGTKKAGIQAWVLQLGQEKKTENIQKIRVKLVSQGHKFPRGKRLRAKQ
jgi:hypothetical protein